MRSIPTFIAMVATVVSWSVPTSAQAQYLDEPVAILCIAGIDRLLEDVQAISLASGDPGLQQRVQQRLEQAGGLAGIDRGRPIALLAYAHRDDRDRPGFAVAVPVADVAQLQQVLQSRLPVRLAQREGDRWVLERPGKTDPARMIDETLFICTDEALLPRLDAALLKEFDELADRYDVALRFRRAGVHGAEVDRLLEELQRLVERESERKPGEDHRELAVRRKLVGLFDQLVRSVVQETDRLELGATLAEGIEVTARWSVHPEGRLSHWLARLPLTEDASPIGSGPSPEGGPTGETSEAAASLRIAVHLPPDVRESLDGLLSLIRGRVLSELEPRVNPETIESVSGLFDVVQRTVATGRIEGGARFVSSASGGHMLFLARLFIDQGRRLEESLETILPYAEKSADVTAVELNVVRDESLGLHLHRITPEQFRPREERLYGPGAAIYVGTDPTTFWFAAGGSEVPEAITHSVRQLRSERPSADPARDPETDDPTAAPHAPHLLEIRWSSHQWLRLIEQRSMPPPSAEQPPDSRPRRIERQPEAYRQAQLLRQAIPDDTDGEIRITLSSHSEGAQARISFESGYVRFLGLLLSREQPDDR
jgi:hypothetical protein